MVVWGLKDALVKLIEHIIQAIEKTWFDFVSCAFIWFDSISFGSISFDFISFDPISSHLISVDSISFRMTSFPLIWSKFQTICRLRQINQLVIELEMWAFIDLWVLFWYQVETFLIPFLTIWIQTRCELVLVRWMVTVIFDRRLIEIPASWEDWVW
jgi:hypothetical protein